MIINKTNCEDCIHCKVCKNKDNSKRLSERLRDLTYGSGPNDDYDWDTMSNSYNVNIELSCPDFEKKKTSYIRGENLRSPILKPYYSKEESKGEN